MEESLEVVREYVPVYEKKVAESLAADFSRLKEECYVDHAGATLYSDKQIRRVADDLNCSLYANPHSVGTAGGDTQDSIERMRYRILEHFNTTPEEYSVIFTSGATHSLKLVAESFVFTKNERNSRDSCGHFVYTQDNHTSVLGMREIVSRRGAEVSCVSFEEAFQVFRNPTVARKSEHSGSNSLFVYPAQCNFSGFKYPLKWIKDAQNGSLSAVTEETRWFVLLDAAAYVATNPLDLSQFKPDFVSLSFYKMFGYPTGIGALLVRNSSADTLQKVYYGGGTVEVSLSSKMFHVKRRVLHQRFEDGTVPFLSIVSLRYGFDILSGITMKKISKHVFSLARNLHHSLLMLHHCNGKPVVKLYADTCYENCETQGGVVTFNLMRSNGEYVGYMEVLHMAALFKIHLRTGCFCNPGACQRHLSLTDEDVLQNYDAGYVCGGSADIIHGKPTGAVRISFGYMSTIQDVQTVLTMVSKCFVDEPSIEKVPDWWKNYKLSVINKYNQHSASNGVQINDSDNGVTVTNNNRKENGVGSKIFHHSLSDSVNDVKIDEKSSSTKMTLERLFIYPIKSCAAYEITNSWTLTSKGLQYDREWMIVTSAGKCLTQKQEINLCLIKPVISLGRKTMTLFYSGMPPIDVPLEQSHKDSVEGIMCQSKICGHRVKGIDCGADVSEWLSLALRRPNLRLIRQSSNNVNDEEVSKVELTFSSQAQYLLLNESSIYWLIDKISENSDLRRDTVLHRFRGNIVIKGCSPFLETQWKYIHIGNNSFTVNGPCTRCQMICIDQTTGKKTVEPLRTLAEEFHGKLRFGIYLSRQTKEDGIIKIGIKKESVFLLEHVNKYVKRVCGKESHVFIYDHYVHVKSDMKGLPSETSFVVSLTSLKSGNAIVCSFE